MGAQRRAGSWPALLGLTLLFVAAFFVLRSRSSFLRIERDQAAATAVAIAHGLSLADALALRDLVGVAAPDAIWQAAAAAFAAQRADLGDPLAAVFVAGEPDLAVAARRSAATADAAWSAFRERPQAVSGLRFLALRERFAARIEPRD